MISAWQHDQARERSPPIDGRLGKSHQRQREGKVVTADDTVLSGRNQEVRTRTTSSQVLCNTL